MKGSRFFKNTCRLIESSAWPKRSARRWRPRVRSAWPTLESKASPCSAPRSPATSDWPRSSSRSWGPTPRKTWRCTALNTPAASSEARVAARLQIRHTPVLSFKLDETAAKSVEMSRLIDQAIAADRKDKPGGSRYRRDGDDRARRQEQGSGCRSLKNAREPGKKTFDVRTFLYNRSQ